MDKNLKLIFVMILSFTFIAPFTSAWWDEGLNNGLISYYNLDESSGNAEDLVGGYDLVNTGLATYHEGLINNAANLSNVKYLVSNSQGAIAGIGTGDFSISLWVNATYSSGDPVLFGQLTTWNDGWGIILRDSGELHAHMGASSGDTSGVNIKDGNWHHLLGIRDGSNVKWYVDNIEELSLTSSTNYNLDDFILGGAIIGGRNLKSSFDEVGIWTRALNSSERSELYNGGDGISYSSSASAPENKTFSNVEIITNLIVGENITGTNVFFNHIGNSISRIMKGWFTEIDATKVDAVNISTQSLEVNNKKVCLEDGTNCQNNLGIKSGVEYIEEGTCSIISFNNNFSSTPNVVGTIDTNAEENIVSTGNFSESSFELCLGQVGRGGNFYNVSWIATNVGN